ncbi:MAG: hypothetical protein GPJ52_01900 [Candidatus Heimdallarchaeota archaeon]|nr:hypothetical protein [Candidatus Heimdallarchaeota archaeon]
MSESIQHDELPPEKAYELLVKTERKENILSQLQELIQQSDSTLAKASRKMLIDYQKRISNIDPQFLDVSNFGLEFLPSLFWKARIESGKERNYPEHIKYENFFYFDLIELRNGTHILVTMIKPFWRNWFEETKPNKTRDSQFFKCPNCRNSSFYSQWQNGCNTCFFPHDYPAWGVEESYLIEREKRRKRSQKRRRKRVRRKNFLIGTGLWVFFVRAYVSCPFTKGKWLLKEQVLKYFAGED